MSNKLRVPSFVLGLVSLSLFSGCNWSGDVFVNSFDRDMSYAGSDDLAGIQVPDLSGGCGLNTCSTMNANCGPIGDGCGGTLNCGPCTLPQTCGGGGTPYQCGGMAGCIPLTCAQLGLACGPAGDGCNGTLNCDPPGGCPSGDTCGGGGTPGQCGHQPPSGGTTCVPTTCAKLGFACGMAGDGCGNTLNCGNCTVAGQTCGGSGVPFQCGGNLCMPTTCAKLGYNCGTVGDGCGLTLNCGSTCPAGQTCGGGGQPNKCGVASCTPHGCGTANCGQVGDGCGGLTASCGTCTIAGQSCGGGGTPNVCGAPSCVAKTCAQLGFNCGAAGDGCGNLIPGGCGTCTAPNICGAVQPNVCGNNVGGGGTTQCDMGNTTITGTVVAPTDATAGFGNPDPIYNAVVYVPSGAIQPITTGASCEQCTTSQPSVVSFTTGIDGKFTLTNPPTGPGVKVVIQLGKWRRVLTLNVTPCTNNALTLAQTRLPRKQGEFVPEDNIPRFAVSTGSVDTMQCVLRKMGIADAEFVNGNTATTGAPPATGRVQLYQVANTTNGTAGARINNQTPADTKLYNNTTTLNGYDAVLFPCTGGRDDNKPAGGKTNLVAYADAGGRVFTTHFSYVWEYNNPPWGCGNGCTTANMSTAAWDIDHNSYTAQFTGIVDQTFPKGVALAQWLQQPAVGASTTLGQIPVDVVRWDFDSVIQGQRWLYSTHPPNAAAFPMHYTFNTPAFAAPANQCGRVVYSDFHVENSGGSHNVTFPTECNGNSPLTPQEKLLEFMLFDLTSCVQPDVPTCTKKTCAGLGYMCGTWGDGCGGTLDCGTCPTGFSCGGGGGAPGQCTNSCTPTTCAKLGYSCGQWGDGCGNTLNCGTCTVAGQTCGGGGTPGQCGGGCTPVTCGQLGATCGTQGNGCGGTQDCGMCTPPQTCGGGGTPNQCGGGCKPLTCAQLGLMCGPAGDGCGGSLDCGMCTAPQTCGGGGTPGVCGQPPDGGVACTPLTCADQGLMCGAAGDGCGHLLDCGPCTPPLTCGGGGTPGQCGAPNCKPLTCADLNAECGVIGDGCGGSIDCGMCTLPKTCGGTGVPWHCGAVG